MFTGLPSEAHERAIDDFVEMGFKRVGFSSWLKCVAIKSSLLDSSESPDFDLHKNFIAFTDGLPNARKMKSKRTIKFLQNLVPHKLNYDTGDEYSKDEYEKLDDYEKRECSDPIINFDSVYPYTGFSELNPLFLEQMSRNLMVLPDCWRFDADSNTVEIIEVTDYCHLTFGRLLKYAVIDDLLWCWAGIRISIKEIYLKGSDVIHDLGIIYDGLIDAGNIYWIPDDENGALKWYYKELNSSKKGA